MEQLWINYCIIMEKFWNNHEIKEKLWKNDNNC